MDRRLSEPQNPDSEKKKETESGIETRNVCGPVRILITVVYRYQWNVAQQIKQQSVGTS
jgi:hypothetical protein